MIFFNKNLLFLRIKKGMTLKDISKEIGFSTSQWNNYELGYSYPKFLDLIKISKYFNITETDLIHKELEGNKNSTVNESKMYEVILIQNKILKKLDEKIKFLETEIIELKNTL